MCCGLPNHTTTFVAWTVPLNGLSKHPLWYFLLFNVAKKAEKAVHALLPPTLTVCYGCEHVFAGGHATGVLYWCISRPFSCSDAKNILLFIQNKLQSFKIRPKFLKLLLKQALSNVELHLDCGQDDDLELI